MDAQYTKIEAWIQALKIALIENNMDEAFRLTQELPFDSEALKAAPTIDSAMREYLDIARELIGQTIDILQTQRDDTRKQIEKIRQTRKFLLT